jgi:5-formyltetrahydrofolate cyclo-ligase
MTSRVKVRQQMRSQRRALSDKQILNYATNFALSFSKSKTFCNAQHIAFYMANDGELDLSPLINIAWSRGKTCYLPVLNAPYDKRLKFAKYIKGVPMGRNRYGIDEPMVAAREHRLGINLDLILTPLVAFDDKGHRIGMGGGYYDRTFACQRHRQYWHRPKLIGVGYDFQRVKKIKAESWDVPLHSIAIALP